MRAFYELRQHRKGRHHKLETYIYSNTIESRHDGLMAGEFPAAQRSQHRQASQHGGRFRFWDSGDINAAVKGIAPYLCDAIGPG